MTSFIGTLNLIPITNGDTNHFKNTSDFIVVTEQGMTMIFANPAGLEQVAFLLANPNKGSTTVGLVSELALPGQEERKSQ
jgi:hypothetical protein